MTIKRKIITSLSEITYEMREPTPEELDQHDIEINGLSGKYEGDVLIAAQVACRVKFFDVLHINSSIPKNEIRKRHKAGEIYKLFEYWESVPEKN